MPIEVPLIAGISLTAMCVAETEMIAQTVEPDTVPSAAAMAYSMNPQATRMVSLSLLVHMDVMCVDKPVSASNVITRAVVLPAVLQGLS